jgi:hypothetical protein
MNNMEDYKRDYRFFFFSTDKFYPTPLVYSDKASDPAIRFTTLYNVTEESALRVRGEGTVAGFSGPSWSERLWLDIDGYDKAETVELKLKRLGLDYVAYDSGSKGAHFGLLRNHPPSHLLYKKDKRWVLDNFPEADKSIYTPLHLFRLPGSTHEATGRRKEIVSENRTGKSVEFSKETELVHTPYKSSSHVGTSLFLDPRFNTSVKVMENGERHYALVKAAYALKDKGADINTARWVLEELNKTFREEKEPFEVNKIVEGIFSRT